MHTWFQRNQEFFDPICCSQRGFCAWELMGCDEGGFWRLLCGRWRCWSCCPHLLTLGKRTLGFVLLLVLRLFHVVHVIRCRLLFLRGCSSRPEVTTVIRSINFCNSYCWLVHQDYNRESNSIQRLYDHAFGCKFTQPGQAFLRYSVYRDDPIH